MEQNLKQDGWKLGDQVIHQMKMNLNKYEIGYFFSRVEFSGE